MSSQTCHSSALPQLIESLFLLCSMQRCPPSEYTASPIYVNLIPVPPTSLRDFIATLRLPIQCIPPTPAERIGLVLGGSLQLTDILGTGSYGVVYAAVHIRTGARYAIKCLNKVNTDGNPIRSGQVAACLREIQLHAVVSTHPNVVSMFQIMDSLDCVYIVLEYCPDGDLLTNITGRSMCVGDDELFKTIFFQILDAVEHCHSLGIYHRDLKPENILITNNGNTIKLTDFGLATSEACSKDRCGSLAYMSPGTSTM